MVIYDLNCSRGHHFEGWFQNLEDLESQLAGHMLTCPVCGDENITRRPSTFGLVKSGREQAPPPRPGAEAPMAFEDIISRLEELSAHLEKNFDDVGSSFAEEALKMHYGAADRRNIRGLSTAAQEEMLKKEGVEFHKMPMLNRKNSSSTKN